ncbi:MAG: hypothetical protein CEN90_250 [Parcubacteria group bacterium Licking1014_17]|nr:MAG: hypothetical protein CEN90_250 [Parcubacteria group bacterium Licking1014_17]
MDYPLKRTSQSGFTLVEMITTMAIMTLLMTLIFFNFRDAGKNKSARHQIANKLMADLRQAQSFALAGSPYLGDFMCGYGIHFSDKTVYVMYAKKPMSGSCAGINRNFDNGDPVVDTIIISNKNFEVIDPTGNKPADVFYEPPNPTIFIDNDPAIAEERYFISPVFKSVNCASAADAGECSALIISNGGTMQLLN